MQQIKKIPLTLTLFFLFLFFVTMAHAQISGQCADVVKDGYNRYFLLNGKDLGVENTDLSGVNENMKTGKIKQLFSKSMKGRIVSRSLLNKFIQEVA